MKKEIGETAKLCSEILDTCAVSNLRKLSRLTTNHFNEKIKPTGMRTTQICVMLSIGKAKGKSLSYYADDLGMDLSTLARSVELLEQGGFVKLKAGNRRERLASLTSSGEKKIAEVYPLWAEAQEDFIRSFGEERWESYLKAAAADDAAA